MRRAHVFAAATTAALAGAVIVPAALAAPAVENQGRTPQLRLTTTSTTINVAAGRTVSRTILCPRGRTPLWWGFIASSQTGRSVTAADLDQVLAVRSSTRAGLRVTFTGAAAAAVRAVVDLTCAQGRAGLVTRLTPRGRAARQTPTRPTLTVTSRLNNGRLAAGAAASLTVLCRAGALASTYGYVERGASVQGAIPVTRGARQGFRVRFKNTSAQPAQVTAQALCHEVSRLRRTTNRTLGVQRAAQSSGPPGPIARGYITVDNAMRCSTIFPNDCSVEIPQNAGPTSPLGGGLRPEFDGGALWGDWFQLPDNRAVGDSLVHIDTNGAANGTTFGNDYTFYGRYPNGQLGSQSGIVSEREPLGVSRTPYLPIVTSNGRGGQRPSQAPGPSAVVGRVTLSTPFLSATNVRIVDARRARPVSQIQPMIP